MVHLEINDSLRPKTCNMFYIYFHFPLVFLSFFFPGKPHSFVLFVCYLPSITITLLNQFSSSVHMLCNLGNVSPNCPLSQSSIFHKVDLYLVASNMGFGFVIVLFSFCAFLGFPFHYVLHFLTTFIINLFSLMP